MRRTLHTGINQEEDTMDRVPIRIGRVEKVYPPDTNNVVIIRDENGNLFSMLVKDIQKVYGDTNINTEKAKTSEQGAIYTLQDTREKGPK